MALRRIVLSRTDSIGDVILTLPMAGALRQRYPDLYIIFLGATYTRPIVECCPYVNEFADWSIISKKTDTEKINTFKKFQADAIIHVFPQREIARLAKKAEIPVRVGTAHRAFHWRYCNRRVNFSRKNSDLHEAQLNFQLFRPFRMPILNADLQEVRKCLSLIPPKLELEALHLLHPDKFNLIIHPKSKGSAREWGIDNFGKLIDLLPAEKFRIFLCGTSSEEALIGDLLSKVNDNVVNLCGKLSLSEYITFIAAADGLIAASTGPLHIAAAVGSHAIGLYPPIHPMHAGRWGALGDHVKIFTQEKECDDCRHTTDCACMRAIRPEMVRDYLITLL